MQALEVGHLGCVTGFHQGLETGLDEFHGTAAQHRLFTEQIGLGLFTEVGLDDAPLGATVGSGI